MALSNAYSYKLSATNSDFEALKQRGYIIGKKIGKGCYSLVLTAHYIDRATNKCIKLACKVIDKTKAQMDFLLKFLPRELELMTKVDHPNIIQVHSILQRGPKIFIFMRYAENGDLLDYIKNNGPISETQSKEWFFQMINALKYLHNLNIAHRDLKCENILLTKRMNIKIADFGFARYFQNNNADLSKTYCGSTAYAAPEIVSTTPYDPKIADIWSIGIILFVMINAVLPFEDGDLKKLLSYQKRKNYHFSRKIIKSISNECIHLIDRILEPDINNRYTLEQIENCDWFRKNTSQHLLSNKENNINSSFDHKNSNDKKIVI